MSVGWDLLKNKFPVIIIMSILELNIYIVFIYKRRMAITVQIIIIIIFF